MNPTAATVTTGDAFARDERGAAMVEFAFVAVILFTLVFGIIDFGRAIFLYNNLTNAAREGARFAAVQFPNPCTSATAIKTRTADRIREFNNNPAANPQSYVTVACTMDPTGAFVNKVTVSINAYPFRAITPLPPLQNLTLGSAAIPIRSTVRFEGAIEP
jgi:Flp pilus assembly protein TadG